MIASGKLVIGPPRSGSLYTRDVLRATFGDVSLFGQRPRHTPLSDIKGDWSDLKVIGIRRNPWAWYVSRWACKETMQQSFSQYLNENIRNPHGNIGQGLEDWPQARFEIGAYSYLLIAYHWANAKDSLADCNLDANPLRGGPDDWMQTENLSDDLPRVFGDTVIEHLGQPTNSSAHADYRTLYSDQGRELVSKLDAWTIERFGYKFDP